MPEAGRISMVFVDPDRWGSGLGHQLIDSLHAVIRTGGWKTASLWTGTTNERARRLYESMGYEPMPDRKLFEGGPDTWMRYAVALPA